MGNVRENLPATLTMCREKYGITGPLAHVGAHDGEEMRLYREAGIRDADVYLIEPLPEKCRALEKNFPHTHILQYACADFTGTAVLNVGERTNQSSLNVHPDDRIVDQINVLVRPLKDLVPDAVIAVIDAQGLEFEVLTTIPASTRLVIIETAPEKDASMASQFSDVDQLAKSMGFKPIAAWKRNYAWLYKWCRGKAAPAGTSGDVLDVVYVR